MFLSLILPNSTTYNPPPVQKSEEFHFCNSVEPTWVSTHELLPDNFESPWSDWLKSENNRERDRFEIPIWVKWTFGGQLPCCQQSWLSAINQNFKW